MACGFAMGTDGPVARQCAREKCEMWVATNKEKGSCVFVTITKKLQAIADMLSYIDDKLEPLVKAMMTPTVLTDKGDEKDV